MFCCVCACLPAPPACLVLMVFVGSVDGAGFLGVAFGGGVRSSCRRAGAEEGFETEEGSRDKREREGER